MEGSSFASALAPTRTFPILPTRIRCSPSSPTSGGKTCSNTCGLKRCSQWHQIAKQDLAAKVTKINVGPTEAKYVKFTFNIANSGKIAQLAVYSNAKLTIANTALAGGSEGAVDGKDAKDFGGGKEAKEVAEGPPEEGPPPNLPEPPPFVFVPILSQ